MNEEIVSTLFEDLLGQAPASAFLKAALETGRVAPAYLFAGPDGVGRKLATLRFLEGFLNKGTRSMRDRRRLANRNHPDLLWVEPTYLYQGQLIQRSKAEENGVSSRSLPHIRLEQVREINRFLGRKPVESKRGMVVIEGVESLQEAASNALLKTLEEPGHGLIILLSKTPEIILPTILSRCQLVRFFTLDSQSLKAVLLSLGEEENLSELLNQQELLALAGGSPGALLEHRKAWLSVPEAIWDRLMILPKSPIDALSLARDLTQELSNEQQIWLINWLQYHHWMKDYNSFLIRRLEKLRYQLLGYVQPRLAWEVAFLEVIDLP